MKGLFYHHSTIENFTNFNVDQISKFQFYEDKHIENSDEKYSFVMLIFGDLKEYKFHL
jgi:hypothetical protein